MKYNFKKIVAISIAIVILLCALYLILINSVRIDVELTRFNYSKYINVNVYYTDFVVDREESSYGTRYGLYCNAIYTTCANGKGLRFENVSVYFYVHNGWLSLIETSDAGDAYSVKLNIDGSSTASMPYEYIGVGYSNSIKFPYSKTGTAEISRIQGTVSMSLREYMKLN